MKIATFLLICTLFALRVTAQEEVLYDLSDEKAYVPSVHTSGADAYTFNYATLIRYEHTFYEKHFRVGAVFEAPNRSATYGENFKSIPQRLPNVPIYFQYMWEENRSSHLRASAIFRELYAHNSLKEGITPYIQDIILDRY